MTPQDNAQTDRPQHLAYFAPGLVTLHLQPRNQNAPAPALDPADLTGFFGKVGIGLYQSDVPESFRRWQSPLRLQRDGAFALHTIALSSWVPAPIHEITPGSLRDAVDHVRRVVDQINNHIAQADLIVGGHEILAASPDWLSRCMCGGGDSPAGRPINPPPSIVAAGAPRFRPADVRKEVQLGLDAIARAPGGAPISVRGRQGQGVKVAIFDAFPTSDSGDWVAPIQDCLSRAKAEGNPTARLQDLIDAAPGIRFLDLVRGTPLEHMLSEHRNCRSEWEPPYRHADHGLFIADIIRDIAPAAELSLYRVLNDDGVGDMFLLAQAIEDAIQNSGGSPLVLNFSLAVGPELSMLKEFLSDPTAPYLDKAGWAVRTGSVLKAGPDPAREQEALDDKALWAAKTLFSVATLGKVFAVAAAGNDSCRENPIPRVASPNFPAAIEGVLGASAGGPDNGFADYSNNDDIEALPDDGVIAFGGRIQDNGGLTFSVDGFINMYVSDDLPNGTNDSGYAVWSGTSFSTAIATGLAACIWSEVPHIPAIHNPHASRFLPANDLLTAVAKLGLPQQGHIDLVQQ